MTETANKGPVFDPGGSQDNLAEKEAVKIAAGEDLEGDGLRQEHNRHQTFRNQVNRATIGLFWLFVACISLGIIAFTFHLITPECWHFLSAAQRDKLETLLGSALLSSALTGYVSKRMS